jgi:hypothetical protein
MIALRTRVRHALRDADVIGRCLPGRTDPACTYDLRYLDGSIVSNVPESELSLIEQPAELALAG